MLKSRDKFLSLGARRASWAFKYSLKAYAVRLASLCPAKFKLFYSILRL